MSAPVNSIPFIPTELQRILREIEVISEKECDDAGRSFSPGEDDDECCGVISDIFIRKTASLLHQKILSCNEADNGGDAVTADAIFTEVTLLTSLLEFIIPTRFPKPKDFLHQNMRWMLRKGFMLVYVEQEELEIEFIPDGEEDDEDDPGEESSEPDATDGDVGKNPPPKKNWLN